MLGILSPWQLHICCHIVLHSTHQQNFAGDDPIASRPNWITVTTRDGSPLTTQIVGNIHGQTHTDIQTGDIVIS